MAFFGKRRLSKTKLFVCFGANASYEFCTIIRELPS